MTKTIRKVSALLLGSAESQAQRSVLEAAVRMLRAGGFSVFEIERPADGRLAEALAPPAETGPRARRRIEEVVS